MGAEDEGLGGWPPAPGGAPLYLQKEDHWTHFDNSVNAISFGFVATAILVSMFLVMAIFEKFLRTTSPALSSAGGRRLQLDIEAHNRIGGFNAKLGYPSPKVLPLIDCIYEDWKFLVAFATDQRPVNAREVSVLMPGDNVPKYIAHPVPGPCPPERMHWPSHKQPSDLQECPAST